MQRLQEAASQGRQATHAPGMSPTPPPVPLGVAGSVTLKDFEVNCFLKFVPYMLRRCLFARSVQCLLCVLRVVFVQCACVVLHYKCVIGGCRLEDTVCIDNVNC